MNQSTRRHTKKQLDLLGGCALSLNINGLISDGHAEAIYFMLDLESKKPYKPLKPLRQRKKK